MIVKTQVRSFGFCDPRFFMSWDEHFNNKVSKKLVKMLRENCQIDQFAMVIAYGWP